MYQCREKITELSTKLRGFQLSISISLMYSICPTGTTIVGPFFCIGGPCTCNHCNNLSTLCHLWRSGRNSRRRHNHNHSCCCNRHSVHRLYVLHLRIYFFWVHIDCQGRCICIYGSSFSWQASPDSVRNSLRRHIRNPRCCSRHHNYHHLSRLRYRILALALLARRSWDPSIYTEITKVSG